MKYDFDRITDRKGSFSYKWEVAEGELPMWVADMDFEVAPNIKKALKKRVEHGIFGYSTTPDAFFEAVPFERLEIEFIDPDAPKKKSRDPRNEF